MPPLAGGVQGGPGSEDGYTYDEDAPAVYAPFDRPFYGSPFLSRCGADHVLVIEEESGRPSVKKVSQAFADAWIAEFGKAES